MDKVIEAAENLAAEYKNSAAYKEYARLKKIIEKDPGLKSAVDSFYKASEAHEIKRMNGGTIPFDDERIMSNKYTELWLNETGHKFMAAKKELKAALVRIYGIIETNCDI